MRELGRDSEELHRDIADRILALSPKFLILVGEEMQKYVYETTRQALGESQVFHFANSKIAGQRIRELLYETE